MASSITFSANTSPHSLLAVIASADGVAGTRTRAQVLAACGEGPLKERLTRTADWTVFNLAQASCNEVHVREIVERSGTPEADSVEFWWEATGIKFNCAVSTVVQLEIRFQQSKRF